MDQHERKKIIQGALSKFKYTPNAKKINPIDILVDKAKNTTLKVLSQLRPILQSGGGHDVNAVRETLCRFYLEEFRRYSKDELENLVTLMHVEEAMNIVAADPNGTGKPDQIS